MKILSSEEIRKADAYTIKHELIKSINLMERAAKECVRWLINSSVRKEDIKIFCGLGNNGGDGLAIARLLATQCYMVEIYIVRYADKCSEDFLSNEKRLKNKKRIKVHNITSAKQLQSIIINQSSILIDAVFGSGLNKPVEGLAKEAINFINQSKCFVVSIDIPSGLFLEENKYDKDSAVVRANHTLTFHVPKMAFMFHESEKYVGDFSILNIGLNEAFISSLPSKNYFATIEDVRKILTPRNKFSHKGTFGHALIVSGSYGKMGACVLASRASISSGAGLVTAHIPKCGYEILQTANPEVMVEVDSSEKIISDTFHPEKYNAIGIGPGIGTEKETQSALKVLIQNSKVPLVLDADALNILSENKTWISFLPKNSILTPHPGELKRLIGESENDFQNLQKQKEFSIKHGVYVVLKRAYTCITCPDGEVYFNSPGNPGMATAGSGDVLTGIITGLLAQGYDSKQASVLGVYLHGLAGDIAAENLSEESLIARHIIEFLGEAFKKIKSSPN
ncbi:MAG: NAD(P)H-hydrate dehydratase [Bacteroidetes bacterium]|nr:NAD(P)H-hydrate dehydratase [Bacteroidota bacterium]